MCAYGHLVDVFLLSQNHFHMHCLVKRYSDAPVTSTPLASPFGSPGGGSSPPIAEIVTFNKQANRTMIPFIFLNFGYLSHSMYTYVHMCGVIYTLHSEIFSSLLLVSYY